MNLFFPERDLARAVILRAFEDCVRPDGACDSSKLTRTERDQAIQFLTAENGAWFHSRVSWCDTAGFCPNKTRRAAINLLKSQYPGKKLTKIRSQVF
ncbi:hypothetical protein [Swingsia samuiensis]|uniref:Uncharacterized protein n=1 Tax=Swingsia samuiensis TaxID=1293412 RepID=A0A4Y6UKU9_9PROT|nr:hypothetical protein [Swingsia samuiensis]QDH17420.1 hypothetical protein E3D00_07465 [Swingsia samuiensis]